ncbi:MAG: L-lactate MFS transporter [Promethearchaeota archaeon]
MSEKKPSNRWIIVIAAVLVQLGLGAIYSYGIITPAIKSVYSTDATSALMPFAIALLTFAIVMIFAGRWQDKVGPKIVALTGGVVLTGGYIISGIIAPFTNVWGIVVTYGVIGGGGIGLAYVCPIAAASKWFPDMKGLINGLAVAGFGAGGFIFNLVFNLLLGASPDAGSLSANFIISGLIIGVMVILGSLVLKNPPEGYKPEGWNPPVKKAEDGSVILENWTPKEMVKTPTYWLLWIMFIFSAICGLMVIGNYKGYGGSISAAATASAATIGGIAALFNGLGRVFWGKMSDSLGRTKAMKIMFGIQGVAMVIFALVPNFVVWIILVQVLYFCFGGNFSMFPSATGEYFGTKNLGSNYGLVFTAYGIAGIVGAIAASPMLQAMGGNYLGYFMLFAVLSLVALGISFITKPPKRK